MDELAHYHGEIDKLATVLLDEFGGPICNESACEMAIRVLREQKVEIRRLQAVGEPMARVAIEHAGGMYEVSEIGSQTDGSVNVEHTTVNGKGHVARLSTDKKG